MYLRKLAIVTGIIFWMIVIKDKNYYSFNQEHRKRSVYRTTNEQLLICYFSHALGARLGRFRNYVTAQPMQVTISSVFLDFFSCLLYTMNSWWNSILTVSMSRPLELSQKWPIECFLPVSSEKQWKHQRNRGGGRKEILDFPLDW